MTDIDVRQGDLKARVMRLKAREIRKEKKDRAGEQGRLR
jgi:hypothetical protein